MNVHSAMRLNKGHQENPIDHLVDRLARLPGLGPRSARRISLRLLRNPDTALDSLIDALQQVRDKIVDCRSCGNIDVSNPCAICSNPKRNHKVICVVEEVSELWALEKAGCFQGVYHVLGGLMSGLDHVGPDDLNVDALLQRASGNGVQEVILGLNSTLDGQTTSHYLSRILGKAGVRVTRLAQGIPVGGELDYLDAGTISAALDARMAM